MRSILWPTTMTGQGVLARLGRVLHWAGLLIAVPIVVAGASILVPQGILNGVGTALIGVLVYLTGRGLRYVFSGE